MIHDPISGAMIVGNGGDVVRGLGVWRFWRDRVPHWERVTPGFDASGQAWAIDSKRKHLVTHGGSLPNIWAGRYTFACNPSPDYHGPDINVISLVGEAVPPQPGTDGSYVGTAPSSRYGHASVVDSVRDEFVVLGGTHCGGGIVYGRPLQGGDWRSYPSVGVSPPSSGPGRTYAWWSRSRNCILAASRGLGGVFTVALDSVARWTMLPEASAAFMAFEASDLVYDESRDALVAVSSSRAGLRTIDVISGQGDVRSCTDAGRLPTETTVGYDPDRSLVMAFGGFAAVAFELDAWASATWREVGSAEAPPAGSYAMASNPADSSVLAFGVWTALAIPYQGLWRYDIGKDAWSKLGAVPDIGGPMPSMVVDAERSECWITDGYALVVKSLSAHLPGQVVAAPPDLSTSSRVPMVYDSRRKRVMLMANYHVYAIDGAARQLQALEVDGYDTAPRSVYAGAYYDSLLDRVVCVGYPSLVIDLATMRATSIYAGTDASAIAWDEESRTVWGLAHDGARFRLGDALGPMSTAWVEGDALLHSYDAQCAFSGPARSLVTFGGFTNALSRNIVTPYEEHSPFLSVLHVGPGRGFVPRDLALVARNGWSASVVPGSARVERADQLAGAVPRFVPGPLFVNVASAGAVDDTTAWRCRIEVDGMVVRDTVLVGPGDRDLLNMGPTQVRGGRHEVKVQLDPEGRIREVSEQNNTFIRQYLWEPEPRVVGSAALMPPPPRSGSTPTPNCDAYEVSRDLRFGWLTAIAPADTSARYRLDVFRDRGAGHEGLQVPVRGVGDAPGSVRYVVGSFRDTNAVLFPAVTDMRSAGPRSEYWLSLSDSRERQSAAGKAAWASEVLPPGRVAQLYEAYFQAGRRYNLELAGASANADLSFEVFGPAGGTIQGAGEGLGSTRIASTKVDTMGYVPSVTGWHQLVVSRRDGLAQAEARYGFAYAMDERILEVDGLRPRVEVAVSGAWPNPSRGEARFTITVPTDDVVSVEVYDVTGRCIARSGPRVVGAGLNEVGVALQERGAKAPSAGLYLVRVAGRAWQRQQRMVVVR